MGKFIEEEEKAFTRQTQKKHLKKIAEQYRRNRLTQAGVLDIPNASRIHEQNPDPIERQRFQDDSLNADDVFSTPAFCRNMFAKLATQFPSQQSLVQLPSLVQSPKRKRTADEEEPTGPGRVKNPAELEREREMTYVHEALQQLWLDKFPSTLTKSGKFPAKPSELLEKAGLKWQLPDNVPLENIYIKKKNASLTRTMYTALNAGKISLVPIGNVAAT